MGGPRGVVPDCHASPLCPCRASSARATPSARRPRIVTGRSVGPVGSLAAFVPRVGSDLASHGFGPVFFSGRYQVNPLVKRSEEHTSELQSRPHLVCRLLLEKKKKKIT